MPRLLYLYPEEWTGNRARELHTFQTCLALADAEVEVCLVTAGNLNAEEESKRVGREKAPSHLQVVNLSRSWGLIKSASFFLINFRKWLRNQDPFDCAYVIHLKTARSLKKLRIPYWWEAHEVFSETPAKGTWRARQLYRREKKVLSGARGCVATSNALADALRERYDLLDESVPFYVVPHGGEEPLANSLADPAGPLVYAGSLSGWKGLELILSVAGERQIPLKIIGGNQKEWNEIKIKMKLFEKSSKIEWHPRTDPRELPQFLKGCRAGLSATLPETASGRYSLPMKIFDYARCGLPIIGQRLPSLASFDLGRWFQFVEEPTKKAWLQNITHSFSSEDHLAALAWSRQHTWKKRGLDLRKILFSL